MEKYFIFSDECGYWHNQEENSYYIRSWIKIPEKNYYILKGKFDKEKLSYPSEKCLIKNEKGITEIILNEENNIYFFFTFTRLKEFYLRKFNVRDRVLLALTQLENCLRKEYEKKIPKKVKDAVNYILFLHVYESYHIDNAIKYLCDKENYFTFIIDKPQFIEKEYEEIFEETSKKYGYNTEFVIEKNDKELGIKLVDALAKILEEALKNKNKEKVNFLKEKILKKGIIGGRLGINGLCKIFDYIPSTYGNVELLLKEDEQFQRSLRELFT
jgi:hypothetical protein